MAFDTLSLLVDTTEPRIQKDRMAVLRSGLFGGSEQGGSGGLGWDFRKSSNVWMDAVTYTGMLAPLPTTAAWQTTFTGNYRRLGKADYDIAGSAAWQAHHYPNPANAVGNVYLVGLDTNAVVSTTETYGANRGFWVSYFAFNANDTFIQLEVVLGDVGLEFWSDGQVRLYRPLSTSFPFSDGDFIGEGSLKSLPSGGVYAPAEEPKGVVGASAGVRPVDILILPMPNRTLTLVSSLGGGFAHTMSHIDIGDTSANVTAAGKFRWRVPNGQPVVQVAPLRFATSGYLTTGRIDLEQAPTSDQSQSTELYWAKHPNASSAAASAALRNSGDTGVFVADGSNLSLRLRTTLGGDGLSTPFVYGVAGVFGSVTANTTAGAGVAGSVKGCRLNVSESPAGVALHVEALFVDEMDLVFPNVRRISNRPVRAVIGDVRVFEGRSGVPQWQDAAEVEGAAALTRLDWEWRDRWVALEGYRLRSPLPFAGRDLSAVIRELAMAPGYPVGDMDVEEFGFVLPGNLKGGRGNWDLLPERGDTAAQWLLRLHDDYAASAFMGWVPTAAGMRFRFKRPAALGTTAAVMLWGTIGEAQAGLEGEGHSESEARDLAGYRVYRTFHEQTFPPEANIIRVAGLDGFTGRVYSAEWRNSGSLDPAVSPAVRGWDWLGEPAYYGLFSPELNSAASVAWATSHLAEQIGRVRQVAEWTCDFLLKADGSPVWRGDVVELYGKGKYRVLTLQSDLKRESSSMVWRPSSYTGEKV